jgi:organic radical activating enzyme
MNLPVMEMYYTLQGEGFHTGRASFFIRLGGCDVGCVWCDVKESWRAEDHPVIEVKEIVNCALKNPARFAVITGGEPCMYDLTELTLQLKNSGFETALETSGAYPVTGTFDWICVSPKKFKFPLAGSLSIANELKCIVYNASDFQWAEEHAARVSPACKLFLQPEYGVREAMLPKIIDYVKRNPRWRISLQTHKLLNIP